MRDAVDGTDLLLAVRQALRVLGAVGALQEAGVAARAQDEADGALAVQVRALDERACRSERFAIGS